MSLIVTRESAKLDTRFLPELMLTVSDILPHQIKDYGGGFPKSLLRFPGFSLAGFRHLPRLSCLNPR